MVVSQEMSAGDDDWDKGDKWAETRLKRRSGWSTRYDGRDGGKTTAGVCYRAGESDWGTGFGVKDGEVKTCFLGQQEFLWTKKCSYTLGHRNSTLSMWHR